MNLFHAVAWTGHQSARIIQFDAEQVRVEKVHAHSHPTRQHGSEVRTEHEFYAEVCDAFDGIAQVLVTGSHAAVADFRHYVDTHRPQIAAHVVGYDVVDRLTENQLVAHARKYFVKFDSMAGAPTTPT